MKTSSSSQSANQAVLDRFETGKSYPCWYDPQNPARVVLEKGISAGAYVITGIGALVFLLGVVGISTSPCFRQPSLGWGDVDVTPIGVFPLWKPAFPKTFA